MIINSQHNILTPAVLRHVQSKVFSPTTPWFPINTDYYHTGQPNPYSHNWEHTAWFDSQANSRLGEMLHIVALTALEKTGQRVDNIFRLRLGLHNISPVADIGGPHVDHDHPLKVALIYLNSSDGDTVIYQEQYDYSSSLNPAQYYTEHLAGQVTPAARSTPEENKIIWFDGSYYHSSTSPTATPKRVTLNINYSVY